MFRWLVAHLVARAWKWLLWRPNPYTVGSWADRKSRLYWPLAGWYANRYFPGLKIGCPGDLFDADALIGRLVRPDNLRRRRQTIRRILTDGVHDAALCRRAWVEDGLLTEQEIEDAMKGTG